MFLFRLKKNFHEWSVKWFLLFSFVRNVVKPELLPQLHQYKEREGCPKSPLLVSLKVRGKTKMYYVYFDGSQLGEAT